MLPGALIQDRERLQRFTREARALASLSSAHVAGIYDLHQVGDRHFIAMELVPGANLSDVVRRGPMEVREALDVCRQIADGLEAAHEAGVVHRGPEAGQRAGDPRGERVKILDFGLAKLMRERPGASDPSDTLSTSEGAVLGTPAYMSPRAGERAAPPTVARTSGPSAACSSSA